MQEVLEANRFDVQASIDEAQRLAVQMTSAEDGFFDGIDRAGLFARLLSRRNLIVSLGEVDEKEAGRLIETYGLYEAACRR